MQYKNHIQYLVILSIPILFYSLPLFFGYAWNIISPGVGPDHIYNHPENYQGRYANAAISIDTLTPSIYNLPYDVRLRQYIMEKDLPLWNPEQALGVPFSAQGEGSPYFPLQIIKSILPQIYANHVTFIGFFLAALFLFIFLRDMGVSETASYIGSFSFVLSGALGAMIPVTNNVFSLSVVPFLFWAAGRAVMIRTPFWRGLFSVAISIQILAGHLSITFVSLLSVIVFILYYTRLTNVNFSAFFRETIIIIVYFILGIGLSSFLIFPILETIHVAHHTGHEGLGFYFLPISHLLTFFNPLLFGQIHQGWFQINWFDLFAFAGLSVVVSVFGGLSISSWDERFQRSMFYLFVAIALFWIFRYIGFAPFNWVGLLPFFSQLSPKHANGFTVFCLCVSSAIAINHIQKWNLLRFIAILGVTFIVGLSTFIWLVFKKGYINKLGYPYIAISVILGLSIIVVFLYAIRLTKVSKERALQLLLFTISSELTMYVPLGNNALWFLYLRLGLYMFLLFTAVLFVRMTRSIYRVPVVATMVVTFFIGHALIVHVPKNGLPNQFDMTIPPKHILWLKNKISSVDRTFGIRPGYQAIADIQSLDTTGPFISKGFANFVEIVEGADNPWFKGNGYFDVSLSGYDMAKYLLHKPIFDWLGVKYLVLEKSVFANRKNEYDKILNHKDNLNIIYENDAAVIIESTTSLGRAYFSSSYKVYPTESIFTKNILQFIKEQPERIAQVTLIENPKLDNNILNNQVDIKPDTISLQTPIEISKYEPNYILFNVDAPSSGIVVLKDAFYPGWNAFINGNKVPILEANGMVRAVEINHPGRYKVEFRYLPNSFIWGIMLSIASLIFIIGSILIDKINTKCGY